MLRSRRPGFTIMEILVALLLVATLSAIMLPVLTKQLRTANSAALTENLRQVSTAIHRFREDMGFYPFDLYQLTTRPGGTENKNSCANVVSSTFAAWNGPYLSASITTNGLQIGDATMKNPLTRADPSAVNSFLSIEVKDVHQPIAFQIDDALDATTGFPDNLSDGTVSWQLVGPLAANMGTLSLTFPVRNC